MTLYEILGVNRGARKSAIQRAYRKLAAKYHPDVNHEEDAVQKFKEVQHAYDILSDDKKRENYDRFGDDGRAMRVVDDEEDERMMVTRLLISVLRTSLYQIMEESHIDPEEINIVSYMKDELKSYMTELKKALDGTDAKRKKYDAVRKRFKVTDGSQNLMDSGMNAVLADLNEAEESNKKNYVTAEAALKRMQSFSYDAKIAEVTEMLCPPIKLRFGRWT